MYYMPSNSRPLPQFIKDLLSAPPARGGGLHQWLFRVARVLHPLRSREEIIRLLESATAGQPLKAGEIINAVDNSKSCAWVPGQKIDPASAAKRWPEINEEQRQAVIEREGALVDLIAVSPVQCQENPPPTEEVIDNLMGKDCLICAGKTQREAETKRREDWRGSLAKMQFIVPSPMVQLEGRTFDGKPSPRSLGNVGPRRFLVIEQDQGSIDEQSAVLIHLARKAPLALAVFSGGKSIHGWFYCAGLSDPELWPFMCMARSLGACRSTWCPVQFVRVPGGYRDNGAPHIIYLYNPGVIK